MDTHDHDGVSLASNLDKFNQRAVRCATDFFHTERRPHGLIKSGRGRDLLLLTNN
jgi:hypothetical protein